MGCEGPCEDYDCNLYNCDDQNSTRSNICLGTKLEGVRLYTTYEDYCDVIVSGTDDQTTIDGYGLLDEELLSCSGSNTGCTDPHACCMSYCDDASDTDIGYQPSCTPGYTFYERMYYCNDFCPTEVAPSFILCGAETCDENQCAKLKCLNDNVAYDNVCTDLDTYLTPWRLLWLETCSINYKWTIFVLIRLKLVRLQGEVIQL